MQDIENPPSIGYRRFQTRTERLVLRDRHICRELTVAPIRTEIDAKFSVNNRWPRMAFRSRFESIRF